MTPLYLAISILAFHTGSLSRTGSSETPAHGVQVQLYYIELSFTYVRIPLNRPWVLALPSLFIDFQSLGKYERKVGYKAKFATPPVPFKGKTLVALVLEGEVRGSNMLGERFQEEASQGPRVRMSL